VKSIFLLDVDTQRDFLLPSGAWYLPGAERMIPKLRRLFDFARKNGVTVISPIEWRAPDDPEFGRLPPHCIRGTDGARKIDDTLFPRPMILENRPFDRNLLELVQKHQQIIIQQERSDVFSNAVAERLVRVLPQRAIVFGVMTERAVKLACLGLRRLGVKTAAVTDALRPADDRAGDEAMEAMRKAGVDFTSVEALLGALQSG
jgi:nicotinamidase/pyrazinamidase